MISSRTSTKESRIDEYLITESLPDFSPEEAKELNDAAEGVHFRTFVSGLFFTLFSCLTLLSSPCSNIWMKNEYIRCGLNMNI